MTPTTDTVLKQVERILLRDHKIDNFFCIDTRLTTRLGAYIYTLRNKGYNILTMRNYDNTKNTFYFLVKQPKKAKKGA